MSEDTQIPAEESAATAETQQATHLSGPLTFAGRELFNYSFGRKAIVEGILRNIEIEQENRLGSWKETEHADSKGKTVYFSRITRETRVLFVVFSMTLAPAELQRFRDDHAAFSLAVSEWADTLPAAALKDAEAVFSEVQKRIAAASFEPVPPKQTGPKDE